MIDLVLVTGFLGSGKTSLLRHLMQSEHGASLAFVVNEFADADVDGATLAPEAGRIVTVVGGSIFCRCRAAEFAHALITLPAACQGLQRVVVEASGLANPKSAETMLRESRLDRLYRLAQVVSIVDPGKVAVLLKTLPVFRDQLEASQLIVINKCDCYAIEEIESASAAIHEIAPHAQQIRAEFAEVSLASTRSSAPHFDHALAPCAPPEFETVHLEGACSASLDALLAALRTMESVLVRVKGIVRCVDGAYRVEFDGVRWRNSVARSVPTPLVLIAEAGNAPFVEAAVSKFFVVPEDTVSRIV